VGLRRNVSKEKKGGKKKKEGKKNEVVHFHKWLHTMGGGGLEGFITKRRGKKGRKKKKGVKKKKTAIRENGQGSKGECLDAQPDMKRRKGTGVGNDGGGRGRLASLHLVEHKKFVLEEGTWGDKAQERGDRLEKRPLKRRKGS